MSPLRTLHGKRHRLFSLQSSGSSLDNQIGWPQQSWQDVSMFVKQEPLVWLRSICWINKISDVPFAHWKLTNPLKMAICQELYEAEFILSKWTNWKLPSQALQNPPEPAVQKKFHLILLSLRKICRQWWWRKASVLLWKLRHPGGCIVQSNWWELFSFWAVFPFGEWKSPAWEADFPLPCCFRNQLVFFLWSSVKQAWRKGLILKHE